MSIVKTWFNIRTSQNQAQINSHRIPRLDPIDYKSGTHPDLLGTVGILAEPVAAGSVVFQQSTYLGLVVGVPSELLVTVGELTMTLIGTESFVHEDVTELRLVAGMPPQVLMTLGVAAKTTFRTNPLFNEAFTHFGFKQWVECERHSLALPSLLLQNVTIVTSTSKEE